MNRMASITAHFRRSTTALALLLLGSIAVAQNLPSYYPDEGFTRTGRIDAVEPMAWAIVAIVLVVVTMLGSWLRPPLWPLWVGLALGANLWLYSIALTLDAC